MPNHYAGDLLHTLAISGLSRVRTELFELTVIPAGGMLREMSRGCTEGTDADLGVRSPFHPSAAQIYELSSWWFAKAEK